jgi:hypothetical protein
VKNRIELIKFPVFSDFTVHVEITDDIEKSIKKYSDIADLADDSDSEADAITIYAGGKVCFVFLNPDASIGTAAHEAFHVVESMMKLVGIKLKGETPAYHIGYITERICKYLRKR